MFNLSNKTLSNLIIIQSYLSQIFNIDGQLSHFINVKIPNLSYNNSKYKNKKDITDTKKRNDSDLIRNIIKLPQESNLKQENEANGSKETSSSIFGYNSVSRSNQEKTPEKNIFSHIKTFNKPDPKGIETPNKTSSNNPNNLKTSPNYQETKNNEKNPRIKINNTWMAMVNCARTPHEQNVKAIQQNGAIYFEVSNCIIDLKSH